MLQKIKIFVDSPHFTKTQLTPSGSIHIDELDANDGVSPKSKEHSRNGSELAAAKMESELAMSGQRSGHSQYFSGFGSVVESLSPTKSHSVNSSLCSSSSLGTEEDIFTKHGYRVAHKMCDTMQGELFKAEHAEYQHQGCPVAIKKVDRSLCANRTALEDGFEMCVNDVIKEAVILKHLTCDLSPVGDYIVRFVDLFQSDTHYYLVTEHVQGMNLAELSVRVHALIADGKLTRKEWRSTLKLR